MSRYTHPALYVLILILGCLVWAGLDRVGALVGLEQESLRWRYLLRGEAPPSPELMFVDLDPESVSALGSPPWDRTDFAELAYALLEYGGARVVSFDIIFSHITRGKLTNWKQARRGAADFGKVIEAYPERIVLATGYTGTVTARGDGELAKLPLKHVGNYDPEVNAFPEAPSFPIIKFGIGRLGMADVDELLTQGAVPYFVPGFVELAGDGYSQHLLGGVGRHFHGIFNNPRLVTEDGRIFLTDDDGFTPQVYPRNTEKTLFTLGLETYLAARGLDADSVAIKETELRVKGPAEVARTIPLVGGQAIEVNWLQGWDLRAGGDRVSLAEVLRQYSALRLARQNGEAATAAQIERWFKQFRDKVIFVGATDPLLKDLAPTPYNRYPVPKVGLHANLYRTIDEAAFIQRPGALVQSGLIILLTLAVAGAVLLPAWGRALALLLLVAYIGGAFLLFSEAAFVLPLIAPVGAALSTSFLLVLLKLGSEQMQRRRIKNLFGAYVAPSIVEQLIESEKDPELGGVETEITALFSDLESFSSMAEELSPKQLVSLMNEYLSEMTGTVQENLGTLDKYIGDAVVTMFGMPYPIEDHATRACRAAVAMQERHAELRREWAASGRWPERACRIRTRIGINCGKAVIGNMGSELRFNYTMMGDSVNLAARCESGAKAYGVYTMVTEAVREAALRDEPGLEFRRLDRIIVKGRSQPVTVYELFDGTAPAAEAAACRTRYEAALEAYFEGRWLEALEGFEAAAAHEPWRDHAATTPSAVLGARCREFLANGTPPGWDGVYEMTSK